MTDTSEIQNIEFISGEGVQQNLFLSLRIIVTKKRPFNPWTFKTSFEVLKSLKRLKREELALHFR
jgi:hypothetical protein